MNFRRLLLSIVAVGALALTGCNTFESRAREKSQVFQALPPDTRERLHRGRINVGDSQDMVYIALGYPDEVREVTTAQGVQTLWIYRTYWQEYEGTEWVGWRRSVVPLRRGGYAVVHHPVTADVYATHADDTIRVTFARGVVAAVEQMKRR